MLRFACYWYFLNIMVLSSGLLSSSRTRTASSTWRASGTAHRWGSCCRWLPGREPSCGSSLCPSFPSSVSSTSSHPPARYNPYPAIFGKAVLFTYAHDFCEWQFLRKRRAMLNANVNVIVRRHVSWPMLRSTKRNLTLISPLPSSEMYCK